MSEDPKSRRLRRPSHLETEVNALDGLGIAAETEEPEDDGVEPDVTDPDAGDPRARKTQETP